jgi:hypothetical protein
LHQRKGKPLILHPLLAQQHANTQERHKHRADEYQPARGRGNPRAPRNRLAERNALIKPLHQRLGLRRAGIPWEQCRVEQWKVELLPVVALRVVADADLRGEEPLHHPARGDHRAEQHHHEHNDEFWCAQRGARTHPCNHTIYQYDQEKQRDHCRRQLHHPDLDGLCHQFGGSDNH